jgi:hypothetical protein
VLAYTVGRVRIDDTGLHLLGGQRLDLCPELSGA